MPAYFCSACDREYDQPLDRLVSQLRAGRTGCPMCGGELEFPAEVRAALFRDGDERNLELLRQYNCLSCGRTWGTSPEELLRRRSTGCRVCGAPLRRDTLEALDALAADRTEPAPAKWFQCPICLRTNRVLSHPDEEACWCLFCGVHLRVPEASGQQARDPLLAEPAADSRSVARLVAPMRKSSSLCASCADALLARSMRNKLGASEAIRLAKLLASLDRWRPESGRAFWPLSIEEAEGVVPPVLHPGKPFHLDRFSDCSEVVFSVGEAEPASRRESDTLNLLGMVTLVFGGLGIFVMEDEPATGVLRRMRIAIHPCDDPGVELALLTQIDDDPPVPAKRKIQREFGNLISSRKPALLAYYGTLAVFGAWAGGSAASSATVPAVRDRLEHLELQELGDRADRLAEQLCLARVCR